MKIHIIILVVALAAAFLVGQLSSPRPTKEIIDLSIEQRKSYEKIIAEREESIKNSVKKEKELIAKMKADSINKVLELNRNQNEIKRLQKKVSAINYYNASVPQLDSAIQALYSGRNK